MCVEDSNLKVALNIFGEKNSLCSTQKAVKGCEVWESGVQYVSQCLFKYYMNGLLWSSLELDSCGHYELS